MRVVSKAFLFLFVVVACSWPSAATAQTARAVLYEGARLIRGDGSAAIENSAFLVENGKFTQVGRKGEVQLPAGATRVDLTGKTVIPGLIETHTHIGYERYSNVLPMWTRFDPAGRGLFSWGSVNFTKDNILDHLYRAAYFGVVAVWSAGYDLGELPYQLRDEILAGKHPNAARYYPSGPGLTTPEVVVGDNGRQSAFAITSETEGRTAIQKLASKGVKLVKLWVSNNPAMPAAYYKAIVDEAHKHNMRVGFHPQALQDTKELVRAGADVVLHPIIDPDAEYLALVKERRPFGAYTSAASRVNFHSDYLNPPDPLLVETISPFHIKLLQDRFKAVKPDVAQTSKANWDRVVESMKALRAAGLRVSMGSDSGGVARDKPIGWTATIDMENMVAAGMTPMEAITAASQTGAEVLGLADLGGVAVGKEAAFVVLDANPLDSILNLRKINRVFIRGGEVDRAGLKASWAKGFPKGTSPTSAN
jgi:imidazolonepropionase-like amidohydrolase